MTGFLGSLKADLLDRRLLPVVIVLGTLLAAALAYAALGGGGSTGVAPTSGPSTGPVSAGVSGIVVTQSTTSSDRAVAEITSGESVQRKGLSRDPFAPLPAAKTTTPAAASSSSKGSSSSKTASSGASSAAKSSTQTQGAGATTPAAAAKPTTPKKAPTPAPAYSVAVLFGVAPTGTLPQSPPLTPYENIKRLTPLPSSKQPLVAFMGVTSGGKSATFTIVGEAILRGNGVCVPNAAQCQAIDLKLGQAEQLEYLPASGQPITYELKVVGMSVVKASSASAKLALGGESTVGRELLRRAGRLTVPGLRYSANQGVLVLTKRAGAGSSARAAAGRPRDRS
jgi:hypothetical protein